MSILSDSEYFIEKLKKLQFEIRDITLEQLRNQATNFEELSKVGEFGSGDVAYNIDLPAEQILDRFCIEWSKEIPLVLVSEKTGITTYPAGTHKDDCKIILTVDPLDGTREIMYNKERCWVLSGVAPNKGDHTSLDDIEIAVQTGVRTTRENVDEVFYATRNGKAVKEIWDLDKREKLKELPVTPSRARTVEHGFFPVVMYFEGFKGLLGNVADELWEKVLGPVQRGRAKIFDDQYITSAGELAYIMSGIYRGVVDIRPLIEKMGGKTTGLCAHPYDVCTKLIAERAGAIVNCYAVYPDGSVDRRVSLDTQTNVAFIAYANEDIRNQVDPALREILEKRGVTLP